MLYILKVLSNQMLQLSLIAEVIRLTMSLNRILVGPRIFEVRSLIFHNKHDVFTKDLCIMDVNTNKNQFSYIKTY